MQPGRIILLVSALVAGASEKLQSGELLHVRAENARAAVQNYIRPSYTLGQNGCSCPLHLSGDNASAIIVEALPSKAFFFAISSILRALPQSWPVLVVTSNWSRASITNDFFYALTTGRLHHWELADDGTRGLSRLCGGCVAARLTPAHLARDSARPGGAGPWPLTWKLANEVHVRPEIYLAIPSEVYLVFQTDSFLCSSVNASALLSFASAYHFVEWVKPAHLRETTSVGCNGLSLRSRTKMQRIVSDHALTFKATFFLEEGIDCNFWTTQTGVKSTIRQLPDYNTASSSLSEKALQVDLTENAKFPFFFYIPWVAMSVRDWESFASVCPIVDAAMSANTPDCHLCIFFVPVFFYTLLIARLLFFPDEDTTSATIKRRVFVHPFLLSLDHWRDMFAISASLFFDVVKHNFPLCSSTFLKTRRICIALILGLLSVGTLRAFFLRCGFETWMMQRPGYLSTICAPGRLGNRLFHACRKI